MSQPITPEKRAEVVAAVKAKTLSLEDAAKANGITEKTVRRWLSAANPSKARPKVQTKVPSELTRLREENRELRNTLLDFLLEEHQANRS